MINQKQFIKECLTKIENKFNNFYDNNKIPKQWTEVDLRWWLEDTAKTFDWTQGVDIQNVKLSNLF